MKNDKPDRSEILKLILAVLIFATLMQPILYYTGIHDLLVKLSVESAKIIMCLLGYPST